MQTNPFDMFTNQFRQSTFSYQAENSIFTAIQSVSLQTYFIEKICTKKSIFTWIQSTTLMRITLHSFYTTFTINVWFLLLELKR